MIKRLRIFSIIFAISLQYKYVTSALMTNLTILYLYPFFIAALAIFLNKVSIGLNNGDTNFNKKDFFIFTLAYIITSIFYYMEFSLLDLFLISSFPALLDLNWVIPSKLLGFTNIEKDNFIQNLFREKATLGGRIKAAQSSLDLAEVDLHLPTTTNMDNAGEGSSKKRKLDDSFIKDTESIPKAKKANEILPETTLQKLNSPEYLGLVDNLVRPVMTETNKVYLTSSELDTILKSPYIEGQNLLDSLNVWEKQDKVDKSPIKYKFVGRVIGGYVQLDIFKDLKVNEFTDYDPTSVRHRNKKLSLVGKTTKYGQTYETPKSTGITTHKQFPCCTKKLDEKSIDMNKDIFQRGEELTISEIRRRVDSFKHIQEKESKQ